MREDLTAIMILIDGSGSMGAIKKGVISGFNEFVESQKNYPGTAVVSLVQFDSGYNPNSTWRKEIGSAMRYRNIFNFRNLKEVPPLTADNYVTDGGTPLIEAMHRAIDQFGGELANIPEKDRPSKVIFVTITDGEENSSHRSFTKSDLSHKVKHQAQKYNWQFVYLGANQDSFAEAASYGIAAQSTSNYNYSDAGFKGIMATASASMGSYRSGLTRDVILPPETKTPDEAQDLMNEAKKLVNEATKSNAKRRNGKTRK